MKEYLFRGKQTANGKWAYGNSWCNPCIEEVAWIAFPIGDLSDTTEVKKVYSATVGQYTGLKDANGKKIFEGDILKADVFKNLNRYKAVWTVEYKERFSQGNGYYFYGKNRRFNVRATQSTIINTNATVIGNLHDNPELIEVENNDKL
jgi:uncharacterized phage protein (TIGR01671 family)